MQTDLASAAQARAARRPQPRTAVERMAPYSPPTAGRQGKLRLDFNENTAGCSPRVLQALKRLATRERLAIYPEYGEAREKLAAFFGIGPGQLLFTNGTDEAIQVLVNTYVDGGASVLLLAPPMPCTGSTPKSPEPGSSRSHTGPPISLFRWTNCSIRSRRRRAPY